jgi:CDP-2,3-bis-(O-geranylgeranyl)-sn-glycerol synthase
MYCANATPILVHGSRPLDFGKRLRGKRVFGKGKTIVGTCAGIIGGTIAGTLFILAFPQALQLIPNYFALAFALSTGAIAGDAAKSLLKRQLGFESGQKWLIADQLDFIAGGLLLSLIIRVPEWQIAVVLLLATAFIHIATNFAAYRLGLKKVPW